MNDLRFAIESLRRSPGFTLIAIVTLGLGIGANKQGAQLVHYVDVRSALSRDLQADRYRHDWANELHPTGAGFKHVAAKIHAAIGVVAPTVPADLS